MDRNVKVEDRIGPLAMHTAVPVLPSWLIKRKPNTKYWNNFHKWSFASSDPLTVLI